MIRFVSVLAAFFVLTLGVKYVYLSTPVQISDSEIERDVSALIADSGYGITQAKGPVRRFDVEKGACKGNVAVLDRASTTLDFLRKIHTQQFENHAEFHGASLAHEVPGSYVIDHYVSRSLAIVGIDRPVAPYALMAWADGCPPPAANFAGLLLHYRAYEKIPSPR